MPGDGFGSGLWKNVRAVRFGRDGGIEAPVRANGREGIDVGLEAIAEGGTRRTEAGRTDVVPPRPSWRRFFRR